MHLTSLLAIAFFNLLEMCMAVQICLISGLTFVLRFLLHFVMLIKYLIIQKSHLNCTTKYTNISSTKLNFTEIKVLYLSIKMK